MVTTIQISDEVWNALNRFKLRGETFDDVLKDLIKKNERDNNLNKKGGDQK